MSTAILYQEPLTPKASFVQVIPGKPPRKPLLTNDESRTQIRLTMRDVDLLETLYTTRYMTGGQIQALFWRENRGGQFGQLKACQRRLRQMTHARLLRRIEQPAKRGEGSKPYLYAIGPQGAQLLIQRLRIDPKDVDWRAKSTEENWLFLHHILACTDARIAVTLACEKAGVALAEWLTDRELKLEGRLDYVTITAPDGTSHKTAVIPDAFFVLERDGKKGLFFLEVDRCTEVIEPVNKWERRSWRRKILTYLAYLDSAVFQQRYEDKTAQVLTITTTGRRLAGLLNCMEKASGDDHFWFTTVDQATPETVLTTPIWQRAGHEGLHSIL